MNTRVSNIKSKRLEHIDILKGIFIIFVVIGHLENTNRALGYENDAISFINSFEISWYSIFMPSFFIISGYCSNFDDGFKSFFIKSTKTILWPAIFFTFLLSRFRLLEYGCFDLRFLIPPKCILLYGSAFWFLTAMYLSRIMYYGISRIRIKDFYKGFVCVLLMFLGVLLYSFYPKFNYWYIEFSFLYVVFYFIGDYFKKYANMPNKYFLIIGLVYVLIILLSFIVGFDIPNLSFGLQLKLYQIPLELVLAITGFFLLYSICRYIGKNKVLSFIGQNSIIVYIFHQKIYHYILNIFGPMMEKFSFGFSFLFAILIILTTLIVVSIISFLLRMKYLRWTLGKF